MNILNLYCLQVENNIGIADSFATQKSAPTSNVKGSERPETKILELKPSLDLKRSLGKPFFIGAILAFVVLTCGIVWIVKKRQKRQTLSQKVGRGLENTFDGAAKAAQNAKNWIHDKLES